MRPATAERVIAAAEAVGYHAASLLRRRAEAMAPKLTLGFVLQHRMKVFYQNLARTLEHATDSAGARTTAYSVPDPLGYRNDDQGAYVTTLELSRRHPEIAGL